MATSSRATAFTSPLTSSGASADIQLPSDATDTISSVRWSPVANHLAGSSWDGNVRVYDVAVDGSARGVAMLNTNGPALSCDWSKVSRFVLTQQR
jgi:mRNA export factor